LRVEVLDVEDLEGVHCPVPVRIGDDLMYEVSVFSVQGAGCRVHRLVFRVWGTKCRVQVAGCRAHRVFEVSRIRQGHVEIASRGIPPRVDSHGIRVHARPRRVPSVYNLCS